MVGVENCFSISAADKPGRNSYFYLQVCCRGACTLLASMDTIGAYPRLHVRIECVSLQAFVQRTVSLVSTPQWSVRTVVMSNVA